MRAAIKKLVTVSLFSLLLTSQSGFAQVGTVVREVGSRVRLLYMGVEAALRTSGKNFRGLSSILVKELDLAGLKGFTDQELGTMFTSIRLAAESSSGREILTVEQFNQAIVANNDMKQIIDTVLKDVSDDASKEVRKSDLSKLTQAGLGSIVDQTAHARQSLITGSSEIMACPDCGITTMMRRYGVTLYLRKTTEAEMNALKNAPASAVLTEKNLAESLARQKYSLSSDGRQAFETMSPVDQALVLAVARDANGSLKKGDQELAVALLKFSRVDASGGINVDRGLAQMENAYKGTEAGAGFKDLLDEANATFPEAKDRLKRRDFLCRRFRSAGNTPMGLKQLQAMDSGHCWADFFAACKN